MKTKKIVTLAALLMLFFIGASADGSKSLRLSEVALGDSANGGPWIEIQNTSYGTQNLGGFYITNNPKALDKTLSAPDRIKLMHLIPTGNPITKVTPQNCIMLIPDAKDNLGIQHLNFQLKAGDTIAIFSGNGVDSIDCVIIPADLQLGQSFARDFQAKEGAEEWSVCQKPTPTQANDYETAKHNNKIGEFKEKDPHGFAMAIMAMGVVFGCLILLYVFFSIFGKIARKLSEAPAATTGPSNTPAAVRINGTAGEAEVAAIMAVTEATAGTGDENLDIALIALALADELAHDEESGIITIAPVQSPWASKSEQIALGMLH